MPKFYVLEQTRCAVTFVRQIEAADEADALEMDCHAPGEAVGFHLGDAMGDTMEFFALPADPANLPQPFHPEALTDTPSAAPPSPSDAPAPESYTLMHPHDPYDEAMSLIFNHTAGEAMPWQVQVMCNGSLHDADYFATEMDALRWAAREATTIAAARLHDEAKREDAPADPVKAEMLAALKQIRAGAAPAGRWLDADGNAIDGHDGEEDEPDAEEWPDATWEPYTLEEQADFLASVVAIAEKAIARAEGRA